jgi:PAS domain S-box-containing protein
MITNDSTSEPIAVTEAAGAALEALQESEARYRALFEEANDAIFILDARGRFVAANRATCARLGYSLEELLQLSLHDIDSPENVALLPERRARLFEAGHLVLETVHLTKGGERIPVEVSANVLTYRGQACALTVARDIRARKQAEAALQRSRRELEILYSIAQCTAESLDLDAVLGQVQDSLAAHFGVDGSVVWLLEEEGARLTLRSSRGLPEEFLEALRRLPDGQSLYSVAVSSNQAAVVRTEEYLDNPVKALAIQRGFRLLGAVPLSAAGRTVGSLTFALRSATGLSPDDLALLKAIGQQLGVWIQNARMYQRSVDELAERRRIEVQLTAATQAAQAATVAKSEFLANMSHEIRTPLNGILGLGHLVRRTGLSVVQRDYFSKIDSSARLLLRLVNDVLDFSKVESGRLTLEVLDFSLEEALERAASVASAGAIHKDVEVRLQVDPAVPISLRGDPLRLGQVLLNLLANGVKFTEKGEVLLAVSLSALPAPAGCVALSFAVSDTGIGIAPADLDRLFEPFTQGDSSTTRRYGGTGLGLSICSRIARQMGGTLEVCSLAGQGSTFTFTAPFERAAPPAVQPQKAQELALDQLARADAPRARASTLAGARVLVVEDHPINQQVAKELLEHEGASVVLAGNGAEALRAVEEAQGAFDLVLMDLQMPVMDGYTATARLRERWSSEALPIVAMTAHAFGEARTRCLAHGMNDHLAKPFDLADFRATLAKWVRRSASAAGGTGQVRAGAAGTAPAQARLPELAPFDVPGFDVAAGFAALGRDEGLLRRLIVRFASDHAGFPAQLEAALAAENREAALLLLHGLKGVAGSLRATSVFEQAGAAEEAVRRAGAVGGLRFPLLAEALGLALAGAERLAASELAPVSRPGPAPRRVKAAAAVLRGLKPLLEQASLDAAGFLQDNRDVLEGFPELEDLERQVEGRKNREALGTIDAFVRAQGPRAT